MDCPHCGGTGTTERVGLTAQVYRRYRCPACKRGFNERTGSLFNHLQYPTDVVCLVVLWRLRYKLGLRDLAEMFLDRGIEFSHQTVHEWESKLADVLAEGLRAKRRGKAWVSWYVDETYLKVKGRWCYLYRAIDRDSRLIDVRLSEIRDMAAAKAFFASALAIVGSVPNRVTTDGHDSYPKAISDELGESVKHRTSRYLNNRLEQDHRGIKGRYRPMRGFKNITCAGRFCRAHDELRNAYRAQRRCKEHIFLARQRRHHRRQFAVAMSILQAA
ncbi:MAG: IS6 family transposase [Pseudomonadota bacterium]